MISGPIPSPGSRVREYSSFLGTALMAVEEKILRGPVVCVEGVMKAVAATPREPRRRLVRRGGAIPAHKKEPLGKAWKGHQRGKKKDEGKENRSKRRPNPWGNPTLHYTTLDYTTTTTTLGTY